MNRIVFLLSLLVALCLLVIIGCDDAEDHTSQGTETSETTSVEWTCTQPDPDDGNPHAGAEIRNVGGDLDGVSANIQCEYGNLCCPTECGLDSAWFSVTYIALLRNNDLGMSGQSHLACGYGRMKLAGFKTVYDCLYVENIGNYPSDPCDIAQFNFAIMNGIPPESEQHMLQLRFNRTETKWEALYDDSVFCDWILDVKCSTADTLWAHAKGEWIEFWGEIDALESDIPGTYNDPVRIYDWQIRKSGSDSTDWDTVRWVADFDDTVTSNEWEWRAYVEDATVDTLYIYDLDPL